MKGKYESCNISTHSKERFESFSELCSQSVFELIGEYVCMLFILILILVYTAVCCQYWFDVTL